MLERLLDGGFAPLRGYLGRADYDSVLAGMRLADGTPCPLPLALDVDEAFAAALEPHSAVDLLDPTGRRLARLDLAEIYFPDHLHEARRLYGPMDLRHPAMAELLQRRRPVYLGGRVHDLREHSLRHPTAADRPPRGEHAGHPRAHLAVHPPHALSPRLH